MLSTLNTALTRGETSVFVLKTNSGFQNCPCINHIPYLKLNPIF